MAQRIVIFERFKVERGAGHPSNPSPGPFAWRVTGIFLYPFSPKLETKGTNSGHIITPTPSQLIPAQWRAPTTGLDLFSAPELAALDNGSAVFATFDIPFTEAQSDDPGGAGIALLRERYADHDPSDEIRYRFAHTGRRVDES